MNNYKLAIFSILFFFGLNGPEKILSQNKESVITTDSSIVRERFLQNGKEVMEYVFKRSVIKYKELNKEGEIVMIGNHDTIGNLIGLWFEYGIDGKPIKIEDFDKRDWHALDKKKFPYKKYLDEVKKNADRIIIENYGVDFFKRNVRWNFGTSSVYFIDGSGLNWTESVTKKPTSFLLRYDIKLESEIFTDMIEIRLDSTGKVLKFDNPCVTQNGFEKKDSKSAMNLTKLEAYKNAKKNGLNVSISETKHVLIWECKEDSKWINNKYNGRYLYCVYTSKEVKKNSLSSTKEFLQNIYVFNPWSGKFIESKEVISQNETLRPYVEPLVKEFRNILAAQ